MAPERDKTMNAFLTAFVFYTVRLASVESGCVWDETDSEPTVDCKLRILDFRRNSSDVVPASGIKNAGAIRMNIECSDVFFFESQLRSDHLGNLDRLQELEISFCKIRQLPPRSFVGLTRLRKLAIHTHNSDWPSLSLEPDYESLVGLDLLETLDLTYNNLNRLPRGLLCTLVNLKTVNVSHNNIEDLVDLGLSSFSIQDNDTNITPNSMSDNCEISPELETLIVSNNGLKTATPGALSALSGKTKKLVLSRNHISVLVEDTFLGLEHLEHIDLSYNKLAALPPKVFKYTPKLTSIHLSNNTLGTISFEVFKGLDKLQILNLSGNSLDENWIRPGIFAGLHSLVVLDLSSNHMSRIEAGLLSDTNALQYLNLGHNHIHTIAPSHAFASEAFSSNIHTLVLSYNQLKALPDPQTLDGLSVLNTLALDHNQLHSVHPSALRNCTVLEQISLNNNFLTEVPKALHQMLELKSIDLSSNVIGFLKRESLQGLPKLSNLKLSNNELSRIGDGAFKEAPNLQHLDLSGNRFISLDKNTFIILEKLTYLNLAENQIEDINGLLTSQTHLRWLNISQNQLAWFDYAFIPDGLEWLDIHENGVDSLGNYHHLGDNYALKYVDARDNKIDRLEVLSILPSIQQMRLGKNKIKHIDPNTFLGKPNLTSIQLDNNQLNTLEMASLMVSLSPDKDPPMFYLANNPFQCDCRLSWLKRMHTYGLGTDATSPNSATGMTAEITPFHNVLQYPHVADLDLVSCKVINQTSHVGNQTFQRSLVSLSERDFLCPYETHCLSLCLCCDFFACDCKMKCPDGCICYHDATWSTNVIQCSGGNRQEIPPLVPMDATVLHLEDNNLTSLEPGMFLGRTRLKEIHLGHSHIKDIENATFAGLFHLEVLHLGNNELNHISGREFDGLGGSLTHLYLQNNQLVSIDDGAFKSLEKLKVLHLDGNMLIAFPVWEITSNRQMMELRLSANWWQCECEFVRKFRMFIDAHIEVIPDAKRIKCTSMENGNSLTTSRRGQQCSDDMYSIIKEGTSFADHLFGGHDVSLFVGIAAVLVVLIIITLFICKIKESFQIWLHAKYGIRLRMKRQHARLTQANLNKSDASNDGCGTLFDAVILYSMKDGQSFAEEMTKQLQPNGYKFCFHHRDLPGIPYTSEALKSAITASLVHIVILSRTFLNTEWELIKESGALYQLTDCILIFTDIDMKTLNSEKDKQKDVLDFIHTTKRSINWNESSLWRKLRFYLPDPNTYKSKSQLTKQISTRQSTSKKTKLEGGAVLDTSGVWTFTPSISDGINDSGVSTSKLLLTPNGNDSVERFNAATNFPAPPVRKKQPHQLSTYSVMGNTPYDKEKRKAASNDYHQRSKSGGADTILDISLYNNLASTTNPLLIESPNNGISFHSKTRSCGTNANSHHHNRSVWAINASSPNDKNRCNSGSNNAINRKQLFSNLKTKENSAHSRSISHIIQNTNKYDISLVPIESCYSGSQPHIYHKKAASNSVGSSREKELVMLSNDELSSVPPPPPPKLGKSKNNTVMGNSWGSNLAHDSRLSMNVQDSSRGNDVIYDAPSCSGSSFLQQLALSSQDNTLLSTLQRHNQQKQQQLNGSNSQICGHNGQAQNSITSSSQSFQNQHQKSFSMIDDKKHTSMRVNHRKVEGFNPNSMAENNDNSNAKQPVKHIFIKHGRSVSTLANTTSMNSSPNGNLSNSNSREMSKNDSILLKLCQNHHQRSKSHILQQNSNQAISSSNYLIESLITPEKKRYSSNGVISRNAFAPGPLNGSISQLNSIANQNQMQEKRKEVNLHKSASNLYFMPTLQPCNPNGTPIKREVIGGADDSENNHKRSKSTPFEGFVL